MQIWCDASFDSNTKKAGLATHSSIILSLTDKAK